MYFHQADEEEALFARRGLYGGFGGYSQDGIGKAGHPSCQRQRISVRSAGLCLFGPWLFFCLVYALRSFRLRFEQPLACRALTAACGLVVLALGCAAAAAAVQRLRGRRREPSWVVFAFLTTLAAYAMGLILGDLNYSTNLHWYYSTTTLNQYRDVNPSRGPGQQFTPGQQFMDAGLVYFSENATLDLSRSMGFRDQDTYCVAPITVKDAGVVLPLEVYDFWAVGLNCCSGHAPDFHCGEYSNPKAKAGLRLMTDSLRPYYRLAVQQAEAAYDIHAGHPIFFEWLQDPTSEINAYEDAATKYLLVGILGYLAFQLVLVAAAVIAFSRAKG